MRKNSKNLIAQEAFKLFATNTYEQVTYSELEKSTKLTRGALIYHFKTKEDIFKFICDKYILQDSSILIKLNEKIKSTISLKNFIKSYIEVVNEMKIHYEKLGIKNLNKALVNITNQATYYYPNFEIKVMKCQVMQVQLWNNILKQAVEQGEIKENTNINILSELFEDVYCGIAYSGIVYPDGIEIDRLEKAFFQIYETIKQQS